MRIVKVPGLSWVLVFLFAMALGGVCSNARADEADDAMALLRAGKAEQAYQLLAPLLEKQADDPRYAIVLGVAALDSGRPQPAILAFESALKRNPGLTAVRADLARAYLASARYSDAKRELTQVLAENPPDQARPFLERLLATAESGARIETFGVLTGYVEAGYGRDSNITAVTSNFTGGVQGAYGLPGFQPTGNSILRSGGYSQTTAGIDYLKPLNSNWAFVAGLAGLWRGYDGFSAYNQTSGDLRIGTLFAEGKHLLRLNANAQRYDQQTDAPGNPRPTANRRTTGLSADWRYNLDPLYSVGVFATANYIRYPDNRVLDVDETQLGLSLTRRFLGSANASITLSPSFTDDHALNAIPGSATGANFSKHVTGARLSGQFDPAANVTAYLSLGYFERRDDSDFARSTLIARGRDNQTDYTVGASWRFARAWSARAQASRTENHSNIALYSYNRTETFVGVRYDFR